MSETKNPGDKKLGMAGKLTLRPRTETGVVRQSFSHGRSKQVVVEKVKRRGASGAPEAKPEPAPKEAAKKKPAAAKTAAAPAATPAEAPKASGVVLRTLTEEEQRRARPCAGGFAAARSRRAQDRRGRRKDPRQP